MNFGKEFEKYAVKHKGISSNTLDSYLKHSIPNAVASIQQWQMEWAMLPTLHPILLKKGR